MLPSGYLTTLSSTILMNIASDIVEYHAIDLEQTFAGRLLKWGGLIQPDFNDRLHDTLKKSLQLFFQTYPQYNLTGIGAFFSDQVIARQIGDYILNRTPIDEYQVQQALNRHLLQDPVTILLMRQRKLNQGDIIPDFLKCYRRVLSSQLSIPEMGLLFELLDQNDRVLDEMKTSEVRMRTYFAELLRTTLSPTALNAAFQAGQQQGAEDLLYEMETLRLAQPDETMRTIEKRFHPLPPFFTEGLCRGCRLKANPYEYFVSHGFPSEILLDWRRILSETLTQASQTSQALVPSFLGDTLTSGFRLCTICEKLYTTRFSLFLLPLSQDRNVYLELGIAIGLGVPFLLIQPKGTTIPPILEGLNKYVTNGVFRTMRQELTEKIGKIEEYDYGVVRAIHDGDTLKEQPQKFFIAAGDLSDTADFAWSITSSVKRIYGHLEATSLSEAVETASTSWMLDQLASTIQTARFAIYRVDEDASPTTFLALGISIALHRPFLMVRRTGSEIPLDLRGIGLYQFPNFVTLERDFVTRHQPFFDKYAQQ